MKISKWISTQWMLTILFSVSTFCGFAQRTITWKGGTPGMVNEWYCPQNLSSTSLPDEFSDVIIPDISASTFAPPCIKDGKIAISSLMLHANAILTIEHEASLIVTNQIEGLHWDKIKGQGQLIRREDLSPVMVRLITVR
jgi:hypothetical protein